jgi:hypothetical protein
VSWVARFTCSNASGTRARQAGLAALLVVAVCGCEMFSPPADGPDASAPAESQFQLSPLLMRMRDAYPDLARGRFVSVADLETPAQVDLFRIIGPDGEQGDRPQPTLSILRSRNETGAGSLSATLNAPGDTLALDGVRSDALALTRDWRPYTLLLMSIYGPADGAQLELRVISGTTDPQTWSRTLAVRPGWNLMRLDVATIGDTIDLADVRCLHWSTPRQTEPLSLYLDDIILADDTRIVLGDESDTGPLYVATRGRRIVVGVRERFELHWRDGVIVRWASGRAANLVDIGGLGPWPVPLAPGWNASDAAPFGYDDPALFASWGPAVIASQEIVEATPFRVIIAGQWRYVRPGVAAPDEGAAGPGHAWRYVIYPGGAIYVETRSTPPVAGWPQALVGYALGLDGRHGFRHIAPRPPARGSVAVAFALLSQVGPVRADLLWSWPIAAGIDAQRVLASADDRRLAVLAGVRPADGEVATAHLLRVWPRDIDAAPEAASIASDYRHPAVLAIATGTARTDAPGDLDHDGFKRVNRLL